MHEQWNGKLETTAKAHVNSREDLAIAYTPGVAEPCKVIAKDPEAAYKYTIKSNTVAAFPTEAPYLASETSALLPQCLLWKKGRTFQRIRRCQCSTDLSWYPRYRGDHPYCRKYCSGIRRNQSGRHLGSPLFWNRNTFKRTAWYSCFPWRSARNRYRRTCRNHQRPESNQKREGDMPRCRKRSRQRRSCDYETSFKLRFQRHYNVRY